MKHVPCSSCSAGSRHQTSVFKARVAFDLSPTSNKWLSPFVCLLPQFVASREPIRDANIYPSLLFDLAASVPAGKTILRVATYSRQLSCSHQPTGSVPIANHLVKWKLRACSEQRKRLKFRGLQASQSKSRYDRRSVSLGVTSHQRAKTRFLLPSDSCGLSMWVALSDERTGLSPRSLSSVFTYIVSCQAPGSFWIPTIYSLLLLLLFTVIGCSPGGSRPYTDTDKERLYK
jgi:hypothetical protein